MPLRFFDIVYTHADAPVDSARGFYSTEIETLDAPERVPAGSTVFIDPIVGPTEPFFISRFSYRDGV